MVGETRSLYYSVKRIIYLNRLLRKLGVLPVHMFLTSLDLYPYVVRVMDKVKQP